MYKRIILMLFVVLLVDNGSVQGAAVWRGWVDNDFSNPANWEVQMPDPSTDCVIDYTTNNAPVKSDTGTYECMSLLLNAYNDTPNATITIQDGTITCNSSIGTVRLGMWGSDAFLNMDDGILNGGWDMYVGDNTVGTPGNGGGGLVVQTGGIIHLESQLLLGTATDSVGTFNLSDGLVDVHFLSLSSLDGTGRAYLNMTGGRIQTIENVRWLCNLDTVSDPGLIIMSGTALLSMGGDRRSSVEDWITRGLLVGDVTYDYNVTETGRTVVWVIPEPATLLLLSLGAVLIIKNR